MNFKKDVSLFSFFVLILAACVPQPLQEDQKSEIPDEIDTSDIDTSNIEGALVDLLDEDATKTYSIAGIDYDVTLDFVGSTSAKFTINGITTPALGEDESYTLPDGVDIVLRDILTETFDSGPRMVEFMLVRYKS